MKKPKSTKHKDKTTKFEFQNQPAEAKKSPRKGQTMNEKEEISEPSYDPGRDDKIDISSNSEEENPRNNAFGFFPTNSLSQNVAIRMTETQHVGFNSDRKNGKKSQNFMDKDTRGQLRESQSIGANGNFDEEEDDQAKDSMVVDKGKTKFSPWESNQDWHNQSLEPYQEADARSKVTKRSKNSKMGSRDGSRRTKRKIKALVSLQKNRDKTNVSRQGRRKITKNKNAPISFDEFKPEDKFNKKIGANEEELDKVKNIDIEFDPNEIIVDESHMESDSFNFNAIERSLSLVNEGSLQEKDEFVQDNPIEIVEQTSFDKLENYKDRLPCLHLRKSIMKLRRIINKMALAIITNPIFEYGSLCVIVANSISLSMYDPLNPSASDTGFLGSLDTVFLVCYSFEMVLKIVGLGFVFNKGAYLRDSWNLLDFIIVLSAYLQLMISSGANLSVLRSFRVLRPLRTISGIEGLRVIVTALMKAVTLLVDTAIILMFFFIIFAIAGLQLFGGVLRQQCISIETGKTLDSIDVCGTVDCPPGYTCAKTLTNPNYGVSNFDSIFYSLLNVYVSVTLEGWTYNMIYVEKALGWMSFCFFLPLIYIGAFFLLTLTLVVIKSNFSEQHKENKMMKKRQKFILQRQANKVDKGKEKEAKKALKRIKVKNKKVYMTKIGRKDSDDSLAQKKHYKTIDKLKREEVIDKINADLPPYSRTFTDNKLANIRPIFGINDVSTRIKANDKAGKDAITEEFSNSQMSMVNQNNIFYAFKAKTQGKGTKDAVKKDRNVIFDNKTKRKVKMEGMYGISKAKKDGEENIGSYSDLLEGIPLSDNDDEVSNGTENLDPGSEVMFPYDTSLSSSSKTGDKSNSKNNKDNLQNQNEKDQLCISEESMDLKDGNTKQSNDQKVTKIGDSSNQNNDLKVTDKTLINNADNSLNADKDKKMKFGFEGKTSIKQKNTKFSAKIEDGSDSPFTNANALTELGGTITDFNIKAVLNMNLNKKKNKNDNALINSEEKKKTDTQNDINSEEANENNHSHEKHKKNENEETFEDLDNIEADQIQIVKKGMKIFVKRNKKLDPVKDTVPADILQPIPTLENELHVSDILHQSKSANAHHDKNKKNVKKKTNLAPYNIMREMVVNDQLLEGIVEKEEEEKKEDDEDKPKESEKKKDDENKDQGNKHEEDDDKNPYLDKFRYAYLSDIITTGTVSIVVKTNNIENMMSIPNPCAIQYGNIMFEDDNSDIEEVQSKPKEKGPLRRNDTILPGGLARQVTKNSKSLLKMQTKSRAVNRVFNDKNSKKKGRDMEELTDDVILKRIILDIPENSRFYQREYIEKYQKEQAEDKMLDEENNDEEEEETTEQNSDEDIDIFLDRDINFDKTIAKACIDASKRKNDRVDWSGQDIKNDYDPYFATSAADEMSSCKIFPKLIFGKVVKLRFYIYMFVTSSFFDNIMTIAVAINTVVLSLDRYNIPADEEATLTVMNSYFTYIFMAELGLKLIGLGPINYLKDKMNYLDGAVVMLSIVELAFLSGGGALSAFRAVRIMRTFRVLRVARLLKSMQSMQIIMNVISRSFSSFLYLAMLLLLFIFIYALLGMQVFGGSLTFKDGTPRCNFDSFNLSFVCVFQLLTVENWNSVLYQLMRSEVNNIITVIYCLSWIFIGNYMLLNLFLAILLDSFSDEDEEMNAKKTPEELKQDAIDAKNEFYARTGEDLVLDYTDLAMSKNKGSKSGSSAFVKTTKKKANDDKLMDESFELDEAAIKTRLKTEIKAKKPDYWGVNCVRSLYIFHYDNFIRKFCYKMSNHFLFENLVMIVIVCSSVKLAYDTYISNYADSTTEQIVSSDFDIFFTFFFTFESLLKVIGFGFIQDDGSYLRESWNQLDFFIVCASLVDFSFSSIDIPVIRVLRILRTLRPLRFISHNSEMKLIVTALLESVGHIINVVLVIIMVWLMFGILAVNLFAGKLFYCSVDTYSISNSDECRLANGDWQTYNVNFDNVITAMLNLFVISTLEAWPDYMWQAVDGAGENSGPQQAAVPYASYFFIVTIFICNFFFLNFFVGVIFMNYEEAQKAEKESWLMTKRELEWVDIMKMIIKSKPDLETTNVPTNKWLKKLHYFVTCTPFEIVIMVVIVLNMIQMGMTYEGSSDAYELGLTYVNYTFTAIFIIEMLLKWIAFKFSYFSSSWNVFDCIVVFGSILDIVMSNMNASQLTFLRVGPQLIRVLRVMRVSRLIRLINKHPGLQALLKTIMFSLPSLLSVFTLLMLAFFIYAVLGCFLFGNVSQGIIVDEFKNFFNFGNAMLMCIRISTGEDWPYIMYDYNNTASDCISGKTCGSPFSPVFFISFQVVCVFIMLNLFVLVILQQFDQYYLAEDNIIEKFEKDQQTFKNAWTEFAQANRCVKMKDSKLLAFFKSMENPLGMEKEELNNDNDYNKNIVQMDIRADEEGYVYFNELLYKVMKKAYGIKHIRNKKLAEHEANTFMKINKIQEKMSKFLISEEKKAISVNPFLAMMYYNISFKTWMNGTRKKMEAEVKNNNIYGSEDSNDAFSETDQEPDNEVEVSEYSYATEKVESIHSGSSSMSKDSDEYSDSGIETITEHEAEENDKDNPDASFEKQKGKRLLYNEDEKDEERENKIYSSEKDIIKIEEMNNGPISEEESEDYNDSPKRKFDKRKSSCPETIPSHQLKNESDNEKKLIMIEENNNEHTISIDEKDANL